MGADRRQTVTGLGVIFNTTLAGTFPRWRWKSDETKWIPSQGLWTKRSLWLPGDRRVCLGEGTSCLRECGASLPEREKRCAALLSAEPAGGRLVLTNLSPALLAQDRVDPQMALVALNDVGITGGKEPAFRQRNESC